VQPAIVVVAVVAAVAAGADWWSRWRDDGRVEVVAKPTATVAIGVLGVLVADAPAGAVAAAAVGFACCLAGDVALLPAVDRFVAGLASFLVGHVAFVVMFVLLGLDRWWLALPAAAGAAVLVLVVGRRIVRGAAAESASLAAPVAAYLAVISTMAVVGWATGRWAALAGTALFVTSDAILGWRQFVRPAAWMPLAVMVTYHAALVGLALSLA
jgi:uncharacterized membrane protein YhhN